MLRNAVRGGRVYVISGTREWVGVHFPEKTREWPLTDRRSSKR